MNKNIFFVGYKGKNQCNNCLYRSNNKDKYNKYICEWYLKHCKTVCRNCTGIKILVERSKISNAIKVKPKLLKQIRQNNL